MTRKEMQTYMKNWRKTHPHYMRDWNRIYRHVTILGVRVKPDAGYCLAGKDKT